MTKILKRCRKMSAGIMMLCMVTALLPNFITEIKAESSAADYLGPTLSDAKYASFSSSMIIANLNAGSPDNVTIEYQPNTQFDGAAVNSVKNGSNTALTPAKKDGAYFTGWYADAALTKNITTTAGSPIGTQTGYTEADTWALDNSPLSVYAKWAANTTAAEIAHKFFSQDTDTNEDDPDRIFIGENITVNWNDAEGQWEITLKSDVDHTVDIGSDIDMLIDLKDHSIIGGDEIDKTGDPGISMNTQSHLEVVDTGTEASKGNIYGGNGKNGGNGIQIADTKSVTAPSIAIDAGVTVIGGSSIDNGTSGNGIDTGTQSAVDIIIVGTVQGSTGSSGNTGGSGITGTGRGLNIIVYNGGKVHGGNGGSAEIGAGGNGGTGIDIPGTVTVKNGIVDGGDGGNGADSATDDGGRGGNGGTAIIAQTVDITNQNKEDVRGGNGASGGDTTTDKNGGDGGTGGIGIQVGTGGSVTGPSKGGAGGDGGTSVYGTGGNGGNGGITAGTDGVLGVGGDGGKGVIPGNAGTGSENGSVSEATPTGTIDYVNDCLTGLEKSTGSTGAQYLISYKNETGEAIELNLTSTSDGAIPLKTANYDLSGKLLSIQKKAASIDKNDSGIEVLDIKPRKSAKNANAAEADITGITTEPTEVKLGITENDQEYSIDGGNSWVKPGTDGILIFTGLTKDTNYKVITRKTGTETEPASETTEGVSVRTPKYTTDEIAGVFGGSDNVDVIADADGEYTVTLKKDLTTGIGTLTQMPIEIPQNISIALNLNKHNITGADCNQGTAAINVGTGTDLNVFGEGIIKGGNGTDSINSLGGNGGDGITFALQTSLYVDDNVVIQAGNGGNGGNGKNGGNGADAVVMPGNASSFVLHGKVIGGNGGNGGDDLLKGGNGGIGGQGISGAENDIEILEPGTVIGGNGGKGGDCASAGNGGNGGTGVTGGIINITVKTSITGGSGGNGGNGTINGGNGGNGGSGTGTALIIYLDGKLTGGTGGNGGTGDTGAGGNGGNGGLPVLFPETIDDTSTGTFIQGIGGNGGNSKTGKGGLAGTGSTNEKNGITTEPTVSPDTGDHSKIDLYALMFALSMLVILLVENKKRKIV